MVRIRKNLDHSSLVYCSNAAPEDFQPHLCRLNQSGWDVNPLPVFEVEDGLNMNKSGGGGCGTTKATESVVLPSEMDLDKVIIDIEESSEEDVGATKSGALPSEMDVDKVIIDLEEDSEEVAGHNETELKKKICKKNDGKGWNCKREVEEGYSFCKHHLRLIRTYHTNSSNNCGTSNAPKSMPLKKPKMAKGKASEATAKKVEIGAVTSSATTLPSAKADCENQLAYAGNNEVKIDGSNISYRKRSRKMKNPMRAPTATAKMGSCKSGDCVCYLDSNLLQNMDKMIIAEEEAIKNFVVENGDVTSAAAVTPRNDSPSAKTGYENQLASVEVDEVKADGSNASGRKRSRKMKNPKRAFFSSIFPSET